MSINYKLISLIGGLTFDVAVLSITTHSLIVYKVDFNLLNNHSRQTILNFLCFIGSLNGFINHFANYFQFSVLVSNITVFVTFGVSLFGLMIMFHNTAIRAQSVIQFKHRNFIEKGLLMLYCLPPLFLIPMYYAAIERMPLNQSINASDWNKNVYKPIALTLVFTSEALATMTDVYLVYKINTFSKRRDRSENTKAKIVAMAHSVYVHYVITWSLLAIDVALKIIIMYGHPLLFDSIVSICTLSMRSKCNLVFGLELKNVLNIKSTIKKSNKSLKSAITRKESVGVKNAPRLSTLQIPKEMELKRSASGKSNDDHPPVHAKPVHANEAVW